MWFDGSEPERCTRCGFDSFRWTRADAAFVLRRLGGWWRSATAGVSAEDLNRRPGPGVWSALEYGLHSAYVLPILGYAVDQTLARDGDEVHDPWADLDIEDASRPLTLDPQTILDSLEREGRIVADLVESRTDGWGNLGRQIGGRWWQAEATLQHILHDTTHHWLDVGEGLVRIGAAAAPHAGTVRSVGAAGAGEGADRVRPFEAFRVRSDDVEAEAGPDGGPGVDLVLSEVDWSGLRSGTRLRAGEALLELCFPAGFSTAWNAWARQPGAVGPGDVVVVSPA